MDRIFTLFIFFFFMLNGLALNGLRAEESPNSFSLVEANLDFIPEPTPQADLIFSCVAQPLIFPNCALVLLQNQGRFRLEIALKETDFVSSPTTIPVMATVSAQLYDVFDQPLSAGSFVGLPHVQSLVLQPSTQCQTEGASQCWVADLSASQWVISGLTQLSSVQSEAGKLASRFQDFQIALQLTLPLSVLPTENHKHYPDTILAESAMFYVVGKEAAAR